MDLFRHFLVLWVGLVVVVVVGLGVGEAQTPRASLSGIDTNVIDALDKLDTLQTSVDALEGGGGTVFPGDGVDGPALASPCAESRRK